MSESTPAQQNAQAALDTVVPPAQQAADVAPATSAPASTRANFSPSDMMDAINALPERIANALKEAAPATPAPPAATPATTATASPGEQSFAEWWGGK